MSPFPQVHDGHSSGNDEHKTGQDSRYDVDESSLIIADSDPWRVVATHRQHLAAAASSLRGATVARRIWVRLT